MYLIIGRKRNLIFTKTIYITSTTIQTFWIKHSVLTEIIHVIHYRQWKLKTYLYLQSGE